MTKKIEVLDALMGAGKTTAIIKWMSNQPLERFIYVSPLLSEVEEGGRLDREIEHLHFHSPSTVDDDTKSEHLFYLLQHGANVSCTHALFSKMDEKHFQLIEDYGYTIVIDEELQMIEKFDLYSKSDLEWLAVKNIISISEQDGGVTWIDDEAVQTDDVTHKYNKLKQLCDNGALYCAKRCSTMLNVQLPTRLLDCAKRVVVLTYMFDGNILSAFLKMKGFDIVPFTEASVLQTVSGSTIRELLVITPPPKGVEHIRGKLAYSWYSNPPKGDLDKIANAIKATALKWGVNRDNLLYTFPKSRSVTSDSRCAKIKPRGFIMQSNGSPCWLAAQTKATNEYAHVTHIIHSYNRHPNVSVVAYLQDFGSNVDVDTFALSEIIQFLWRGCIRNGQPMYVCIFSARMEKLLRNWLDSLPD